MRPLCLGERPSISAYLVILTDHSSCTPSAYPVHPVEQGRRFSLYSELAHVPRLVFSSDLDTAKRWASVAKDFRHPTTLLAYETSLRLLVQQLGRFTIPTPTFTDPQRIQRMQSSYWSRVVVYFGTKYLVSILRLKVLSNQVP